MRAVIQRVKQASVVIDGEVVGEISQGLLVLLAVHVNDTSDKVEKMAGKLLKLRIFEDEQGKMNRSVEDIDGSLLVISQFTLYGDCSSGNRPGFTDSARPELAIPLYESVVTRLKESGLSVATGRFGADMQVSLVNDGPVTLMVDV